MFFGRGLLPSELYGRVLKLRFEWMNGVVIFAVCLERRVVE